MFDDQVPQGAGAVPSNLPIGEPEDMFAGTDPASVSARVSDDAPLSVSHSPIQETRRADMSEDMSLPPAPTFGEGSAIGAGKLTPKDPAMGVPSSASSPVMSTVPEPTVRTMPAEMMPPAPQDARMALHDHSMRGPNIGRTIMMMVLIVVIALCVGGGLWYAFTIFVARPEAPTPIAPVVEMPVQAQVDPVTSVDDANEDVLSADQAPETIPLPTTSSISEVDAEEASIDIVDNQVLFGDTIDTDEDRLSDDREIEFGTDPRNWDTDGDGLGDGVEVLNWGTDPLDPDTDKDGYLDGAEVNSGYSPVAGGGARLFESTPTDESAS